MTRLPFHRKALVLALSLATSYSYATTINVNTSCILINAINNANTDTDTDGDGGCASGNGADVINLAPKKNYVLTTVNNHTFGPNGLPSITSEITINGNQATIRRSQADETPHFRLFHIASSGQLTLNKLKISGGHIASNYQYGSGIRNSGQLTLNNSTITGNTLLGTGSSGSGIASLYGSHLTLNNSTISNNTGERGGGLLNLPGAVTEINQSTISANRALNGGVGGINNAGTLVMRNSTVSGNRNIENWGTGGIGNSGSLTLEHCTLSNNFTGYGNVAGINNSGQLTLTNSIIANSNGGSDCYSHRNYGTLTMTGNSLIEDGTCNATHIGDPKLAPLLDNGGATLTHAFPATSLAKDLVTSACLSTDQRSVTRPQPASQQCDAGAYERIATVPNAIKTLVTFYDQQLDNGGLTYVNSNTLAVHKSVALRNQFITAGQYRAQNQNQQACQQLTKALTRIDTTGTPASDDYVTGNQASTLTTQITTLRTTWNCGS
ncbi:right-handed parallel beta-helix repeat-containing protein [Methylocucumis oryzae]|uniref:right-handed parallel beta-helix repeat-containing protein n=1 Tax=Methylocucumis oryzae TaxID=1632867 RepID=UPI000695D4CC|nr:right-handed parallel beta-helix repeat-containing protein [Methylocucumis oryzae]